MGNTRTSVFSTPSSYSDRKRKKRNRIMYSNDMEWFHQATLECSQQFANLLTTVARGQVGSLCDRQLTSVKSVYTVCHVAFDKRPTHSVTNTHLVIQDSNIITIALSPPSKLLLIEN